jgi:DNA-binding CsgD family transcriptional regulator/tetratricopeptide (TPR) repeat protein
VQELVLDRTASLPPSARRVLELVALADPLDVAVLDDEEGAHLDRLEAMHLVELRQAARGLWASVEHPLFGEAFTAVLPTRRRVELLRDLVERTGVRGRRRRGDALRAAGWLLATGVRPDAELAAAAAGDALAGFDLELAGRLAADALVGGDRGDALAVLADVRRLQGRTDEAADAARRGLACHDDDVDRARCAEVLALVLTHQRGDAAGAVGLLRQTAGTLRDAPLTVRLQQMADHLEGVLGAYPEVLASTRAAIACDLDDAERFGQLQTLAYAQVMLGRLDDIDQTIERTLQLGEAIGAGPEMIDLQWALRAGVHVQRGTLVEGERAIGAHVRSCRSGGHLHVTATTIHLQLLAHRGSDAVFALGEHVLDGGAGHDMFGVRPIVLGTLAWARARCGQVAEAEALLAQVPDDLDDERTLPFVGAGRAALLAATGDGDGAADESERTGRRALESTHVAFGVVALHAAVGHGRHATLAELLARATVDVDGALLRAMAQHAAAVRDGEVARLEDVGADFARMGARPHAAQAFAEAASVTAPGTAAARRAAARAQLWSDAAAPFRSRIPDVDDALSGRELEIVSRAATGAASRVIAEELYLSVRTVDNHLRNAYRKLEVGGRPGLAEALRPLPPPRPG